MNQRKRLQQRGMTLLEIMIVLAILAAVMGLIIGPKIISAFVTSRKELAHLGVEKLRHEAYPQWLVTSGKRGCPESIAALAEGKQLVDPWGTPYSMTCPPLAIASAGEDGKLGTDDDIN